MPKSEHPREACIVRFKHLETHINNMESCMSDFKRDMALRVKTPTLIAVSVICIGVVGAILGSLWKTTVAMEAKVDMIREYQVQVLTTLAIHTNGDEIHFKRPTKGEE